MIKNLKLILSVSRIIALFSSMILLMFFFQSCSKQNQEEKSDVVLRDDVVDGIVNQKTIDCYIANWYDDYQFTLNFTWDDANLDHMHIEKLLSSYGIHSTYFIQTSAFKQNHYINQYLEICKNGSEIASHTVSHAYLTELTGAQIAPELSESSNDINRIFGYYPATFAHPGSHFNPFVDSLVDSYYLSSRYSSTIDFSNRQYIPLRHNQNVETWNSWIKSYVKNNNKNWIIIAGHGINGNGYEPIDVKDLDIFANSITSDYKDVLWITTFDNAVMYDYLRDNVKIEYGNGFVFINRNNIKDQLQKFSHPQCILTIIFPNSMNIRFDSTGIISNRLVGNDHIISIDLKVSRIITFNNLM